MKTKNLIIILSFILLSSCNKEPNENLNTSIPDINKTDYLKFTSKDEVNQLINNLIINENSDYPKTRNSIIKKTAKGFTSIADLSEQFENATYISRADEDEEMTKEEYDIMMARRLLPDPILENLMDTTLRLGIDNDVYKITEYGTFKTSQENEKELYKIIRNFKEIKEKNNITREDSIVQITPKVLFINSFRNMELSNPFAVDGEDKMSEEPQAVNTKSGMDNWIRDDMD